MVKWYTVGFYLLVYTLGYILLTSATLAEGKGTFVFAAFLVPWLLFVVASILLLFFSSRFVLAVSLISISAYYITALLIAGIEQSGAGNFRRTIDFATRDPVIFVGAILWLVAGQIVFWMFFFSVSRSKAVLP